ncbi:MAG: hypothetical protein HOY69_34760 [Streptomyces sp.]|nr:hypothetical protein [Streptomyces sp.]
MAERACGVGRFGAAQWWGCDGTAATAGGTPGPGGSGGEATAPAAPSASGGTTGGYHAYRNARTGTCLRANSFGNASALGSCSDDAALWSMTAVAGGFHLLNKGTADCLQAGLLNTAATGPGCSGSGAATWYAAPGGGLADRYDGNCLTVEYLGSAVVGIGTGRCDGSAAQSWQPQ